MKRIHHWINELVNRFDFYTTDIAGLLQVSKTVVHDFLHDRRNLPAHTGPVSAHILQVLAEIESQGPIPHTQPETSQVFLENRLREVEFEAETLRQKIQQILDQEQKRHEKDRFLALLKQHSGPEETFVHSWIEVHHNKNRQQERSKPDTGPLKWKLFCLEKEAAEIRKRLK